MSTLKTRLTARDRVSMVLETIQFCSDPGQTFSSKDVLHWNPALDGGHTKGGNTVSTPLQFLAKIGALIRVTGVSEHVARYTLVSPRDISVAQAVKIYDQMVDNEGVKTVHLTPEQVEYFAQRAARKYREQHSHPRQPTEPETNHVPTPTPKPMGYRVIVEVATIKDYVAL